MKLKVGQEITIIDAPMGVKGSQKRKVLQVLDGGVLVAYYAPHLQPEGFRSIAFVPFSNIEEPPVPKAIPGRVYRRAPGCHFYVGRENGRLASTGALATTRRDVDYNPDTDTEVEVE